MSLHRHHNYDVVVSKYSLAYWLFHAITFERKVFSKIHEHKTKKSLYQCCTYLFPGVEQSDAFASVVTDTQTATQECGQQTIVTLAAHARRRLNMEGYCQRQGCGSEGNNPTFEKRCDKSGTAKVSLWEEHVKEQESYCLKNFENFNPLNICQCLEKAQKSF